MRGNGMENMKLMEVKLVMGKLSGPWRLGVRPVISPNFWHSGLALTGIVENGIGAEPVFQTK